MSTVKRPAAGGNLTLPAALAFAAISLPLSALGLSVGVQLPPYFASQLGVSLAVVGGAFGIVRLLDIWLDPIIGLGMDRTRTRFGRYRVWMVAGAPLLIAAVYMLYNAPKGATQVYLIIWLLAMYLGQSIMGLSHSAWAAVLAKSYEQRSRIFGVLTAVGVIGSLTALAIPILLGQAGNTTLNPIQAVGWFVIALIPIALLVTLVPTPETINRDDGEHFKLSDYAKLFSRGNVVRILAADLFVTLGPGWMAALYMFFFTNSRGFTQTGKIRISGGSAGGELMGAVINSDPGLWGAVVAHVPFVDVLATMLDPTLPLTPGEWPEWGNPIEDQAAFELIRSYSPYDQVKPQAYPPLLVTAGLNDPRVTYWEPAKWVARLRELKTDQNELLLKTNMGAGHGGKSGRFESLKETAEEYAFILWQLGVTE